MRVCFCVHCEYVRFQYLCVTITDLSLEYCNFHQIFVFKRTFRTHKLIPTLTSIVLRTQFADPGWRYTQHTQGVTLLGKGGSMVTRVSPDFKDFSIVLEKMSSGTKPNEMQLFHWWKCQLKQFDWFWWISCPYFRRSLCKEFQAF